MNQQSETFSRIQAFQTLVMAGDVDSIRRSLKRDPALLHEEGDVGGTWIHTAVYEAMPRSIRVLAEHGLDVNRTGRIGEAPILQAMASAQFSPVRFEMTKTLLDCGANPNQRTEITGNTLLHLAVEYPDLMALLLEFGAAPDTPNKVFRTPLHWAVMKMKKDSALILIGAGADLHYGSDQYDVSPVQLARNAGYQNIADEMEVMHKALQARKAIANIASIDERHGFRSLDK